jgi:hypothetical protein
MATTVRGVAIRPTVSANKRKYTPELLKKAHARLEARLADPAGKPVTMRTFHPKPNGADADVTAIAGRLTKVSLTPEGGIAYEALLADTDAGKTVEKLTTPDDEGRQHLGNVSIRAYALGNVGKDADGNDTFEDLDIVGLDCTDDPGVEGASVTAAAEALAATENPAATETAARHFISESVDSAFVDTTEAAAAPAAVTPGASDYADPGYQKDKKKRYPTDTKAHALAAWTFINKPANADAYTGAQLKRIKGKIKAALKKFGVDTKESAFLLGPALTESTYLALIAEAAPVTVEEASASLSLNNGPTSVNVSTWGVDPAKLQALIARHAAAAGAALNALDPDADGDVDGVTDDDDDDDDAWTPSSWESTDSATTPAPVAGQREEPTVATATETPAAPAAAAPSTEAAPARNLTDADVAALAAAIKGAPAAEAAPAAAATATEAAPVVAAPVAPAATETPAAPAATTETAPAAAPAAPAAAAPAAPAPAPTTETAAPRFLTEADIDRIRAEEAVRARDEVAEQARAAGITPARRGLVRLGEIAADKPYADMTRAEKDAYAAAAAINALTPQLAVD